MSEEKKNADIHVRVPSDAKQALIDKAQRKNTTVSELVRDAAIAESKKVDK